VSLATLLDPVRHPTLHAAERRSRACLDRMQALLASHAAAFEALEVLVAGGSLARLEAHPGSDLDCVFVVHPEASERAVRAALEALLDLLPACGLRAPKAEGIYRDGVTRRQLLDPAAHGSLAESPAVFGKRMQLLLEARALLRPAALTALQREVVAWYAADFIDSDPRRTWSALINDTVRYLHAYAGWQQFRYAGGANDGWILRQRKLRSSRLLGFAGLLVLLGESSARADKCEWLIERLPATPLERLAGVMRRYDRLAFVRLLAAYETTQQALHDPATRATLLADEEGDHAAPDGHLGRVAHSLLDAERDLAAILTTFLLDRRHDWDPRFHRRLLL
jgi:hypothetical protein